MDKILPGWMLEKPELVCPPNSIQTGDLIGSGQYGSVYKGYYIQGTARFVRAKNIFHYLLLCIIHGTEICIFIRRSFLNRFSVAIKSTKSIGTENNPILKLQPPNGSETETKGADVMSDPDLDLLIDEAKTMYTIDGYHENIVNLQGIVYDVDIGNSRLGRVSIMNDKESTKHYNMILSGLCYCYSSN